MVVKGMNRENAKLDGLSAADMLRPAISMSAAVADTGDYVKDGLLHCGKCHTPKECRISVDGAEMVVGCLCDCFCRTNFLCGNCSSTPGEESLQNDKTYSADSCMFSGWRNILPLL